MVANMTPIEVLIYTHIPYIIICMFILIEIYCFKIYIKKIKNKLNIQ